MVLDITDIVNDLEQEYLNLASIDTTTAQPNYTISGPDGSQTFNWSDFLRYRSDRMSAILDQLQRMDAWEFFHRGI